MKNPFVYGKIISNQEDFCPRPKESKKVISNIKGNQNTYVIGERRVGKSSLVHFVFAELEKENEYLCINIDVRGVATESNLQRIILQSVLKVVKEIRDTEWAISLLSKFKPTATPTEDGKIEFSIGQNSQSMNMSLADTFDYIEKVNHRKKIVIFIDEFPDILKIEDGFNILGQIRAKIQAQSIPYIFAGSHRGEMRNIFENPDNKYHFYNSATPIVISKFALNEIVPFCRSKFELGGRIVNDGVLEDVYNKTNGITGDMYQVCHEIWDITDPNVTITHEIVSNAIFNICEGKNEIFGGMINDMSAMQKKIFSGIVLENGKHIFTSSFINKYKAKSSSNVKKVLDSLIQKNILYKKDDEILFYDPFFYIWLYNKYNQ